jgi:hypothetical protein
MWWIGNIMTGSPRKTQGAAAGKDDTFDSGGSMRRRKPDVNQMYLPENLTA